MSIQRADPRSGSAPASRPQARFAAGARPALDVRLHRRLLQQHRTGHGHATWWRLWLVLALWCCCGLAKALAPPAAVPVGTAPGPVPLHPHAEAIEDPQGEWDLPAVRRQEAQAWHPTGPSVPSFGFSRSVWWLRLTLHNDNTTPVQRLIELPQPVVDRVDLYTAVPGHDDAVAHYRTGDRLPFATRAAAHPSFVFPLTLAAGQTLEVYVRLASHDGLHEAAPLLLWDYRGFFEHAATERLIFGLYYGSLLALLLYNLFLFASTRERLFASYVAYLGAFFMWNFSFRGYGFQYLWPEHPDFGNQILPITAALSFITHTIFTMHYLQTRLLAPRLHRCLSLLIVLLCLSLLPPLSGFYAWSWVLMIPLSLASLATFMTTAMVLVKRGSRSARFYLLSWSILEAGVMLYYLRVIGVLPSSLLTEQSLQIGSALEFVLLAFGLADRMNELKAAKLQAEREALAAKTALTSRLEEEVQERTQQLREANSRLAAMAITDELTGTYNRRHFNEVLDAELRRQARSGEPLALAMFDIDHFKRYNDLYGHQRGDLALQAVSGCILAMLKRSGDRLFRMGGEEFALLIQADDAACATRFIETLRLSIEDLGLEHAGSEHGRVTVSVGVIHVRPGVLAHETQALYAAADLLLYQAKAGGRNRVQVDTWPRTTAPGPAPDSGGRPAVAGAGHGH